MIDTMDAPTRRSLKEVNWEITDFREYLRQMDEHLDFLIARIKNGNNGHC